MPAAHTARHAHLYVCTQLKTGWEVRLINVALEARNLTASLHDCRNPWHHMTSGILGGSIRAL